jgi:hypothetical protein
VGRAIDNSSSSIIDNNAFLMPLYTNLEHYLIKTMDLPRGELLDRIKNGSLYF